MMHHPNMHHQPMSGHPPQHLGGHQGMPGHHQLPPHQMHRENRHVTMARVAMGPSQGGGGMGGMGGMSGMGGHGQMGGMGLPPHGPQRAPHPVRPMHHPPAHHHSVPPGMKPMRRAGPAGGAAYAAGAYPSGGPGVVYTAPMQPPAQPPAPLVTQPGVTATSSTSQPAAAAAVASEAGEAGEARGPSEAARPAPLPPAPLANSKEKTPMCLVNELARYNKIKHQYRLTSETGPAHKKVFTVTLRLGDTEEYTAEGSSIKRAQHCAAGAALAQTQYGAPPPRAHVAHAPASAHHRHAGTVMPTVELNALAMKLCQPAVYTSVPPVAAPPRYPRARPPAPYRLPAPFAPYPHRLLTPGLTYRVRVCVGGRVWLGEGPTPQAARHDAAARALHDLRPAAEPARPNSPTDSPKLTESAVGSDPSAAADILNSEVKSPVSLVHELALKRNLSVVFTVKSERGPPHMRVFVTACTVGDMETEGEGNGKKVSKRRAAEKMLEEMRRRWPPALLRARPPPQVKRKQLPAKKKPRNLIKESGESANEGGGDASDNPISRLAMARHAARARSPQYAVLEERGAARRREFVVQCDAPPHRATGLGPNKKTAKRRAAHNVLLAMELGPGAVEADGALPAGGELATAAASDAAPHNGDTKRKEGEAATAGGAGGDVRQPVPGVLMMDYHQRTGQPTQPNGVSETSATGGASPSAPGAKDQLMYLSQLLGFTVQFSDFPKRNHGEYLSLVSLSTEPPVMCHGGGASTAHSHEQCARAALRALALMGLDAPGTPTLPSTSPAKPGVLSNGLAD